MCDECTARVFDHIRGLIRAGETELKTATGIHFIVSDINVQNARIITSTNKERYIHLSCFAHCYEKMIHDDLVISGVGSEAQRNSVRSLIGGCSNCERSPAYIWGMLNSFPEVTRMERNQLIIQT